MYKYSNLHILIITTLLLVFSHSAYSAGAISGSAARACLENFRDNFSGNFIDFTHGVSPMPTDRRLDSEFTATLGVTFSTHQNSLLIPYTPTHNVYVSNINVPLSNTIVGTPCSGCSDDGRYPYQMIFSSPQRYAGLRRIWDSTTRTKFYNSSDEILHEAVGSDFHAYLAETTDTNTWVNRIEVTGVLDSTNTRQVGYSDDLFFGTNIPVSTIQIMASVDANGAVDSILKSPDACGLTNFLVTPNTGYTTDLAVGGTCPTGTWNGNTYSLNNTTTNCNVSFTHTINSYAVTPTISANGSIIPNTVQVIEHGSTTQFTIAADTDYFRIINGTCGGSITGDLFTTNPIINDCSVNAEFSLINIFTNGFESNIVIKFLEIIQLKSPDNPHPVFYPDTNSIIFYNHILYIEELDNSEFQINQFQQWVIDILATENPTGDFDNDGIENQIDNSIIEILD